MVVDQTEAGKEELSKMVQHMSDYFYDDDGLIALLQPERLQRSFEVLTYLFNWVGPRKNVQKTEIMNLRPFHASGGLLEAAYEQQVIGTRK